MKPDRYRYVMRARQCGKTEAMREITNLGALLYLDALPEAQRHNADALLYANNSISRVRAVEITAAWMEAQA